MQPKSGKSQAFYRWTDAQGSLHIVSSLNDVPPEQRTRAERVDLETTDVSQYQSLVSAVYRPEWASFSLGFCAALLLWLLVRLVPTGWRGTARVVAVLAAVALLTFVYLGTVRRVAGIPGADMLASPRTIVEDAKKAVQAMNARQKAQQEELKNIERESK